MERTDEACRKVLGHVSGAIACGIVDLKQQSVLKICHSPRFSPQEKETAISVLINLFRGSELTKLAGSIHDSTRMPKDKSGDFKEIQMVFQQNTYFAKTIKEGKAAIFLITKKTTNIGMAWAKMKSIIPIVEPTIISD